MAWDTAKDLMRGNNYHLYLTDENKVLAYSTNASIQIDSESIDTSSKFSCRWKSALNGQLSYTISAEALYCSNADGISFDGLLDLQIEGKPVRWVLGEEADNTGTCAENPHTLNTGAHYYSGKATIQSLSLNASSNEIVSCSITLEGDGEILIDALPAAEETTEGGGTGGA